MGGEPLFALPPRVLVAGRLQCAVPLVRVCAAGVRSVRSWRTWRAAQGRMLSRNILKTGRFLVKLGEIRLFTVRFSQRVYHTYTYPTVSRPVVTPDPGIVS